MSPRTYRSIERDAAAAETRTRIIAGARELLAGKGTFAGFTLDRVAKQAGVARMTVYYQFGSKRGLLEALFDELARRGLVGRLRQAFSKSEPLEVLSALIDAFGGFWASDRNVMRRLRNLTALDPEFDQAVKERDQLRLQLMARVVGLLSEKRALFPVSAEQSVNVLHMLTSFETFDVLAGPDRSPEEVTPIVLCLAHATFTLPAA